ncbi:hypothetical protein TNCV_4979511 [Trichonephila clavipes]|nr:hypothetical protein TNCV_4979511 [Trichonephila clavipes]
MAPSSTNYHTTSREVFEHGLFSVQQLLCTAGLRWHWLPTQDTHRKLPLPMTKYMENKPLSEEAATSNDQAQNTKSPPVPPSERPTKEFITDNAAAISELVKFRAA